MHATTVVAEAPGKIIILGEYAVFGGVVRVIMALGIVFTALDWLCSCIKGLQDPSRAFPGR
jgi:hypothetical protein